MKMELNIHNVVGVKAGAYRIFDDFVVRTITIQTTETDWNNKKEDGSYNKQIVEFKVDVMSRSESTEDAIKDLKLTKSEKKLNYKKTKG